MIGDKANDMLLDMVDKVVDLNVVKDRRFWVCSDSIPHGCFLFSHSA